MAQVKYRGNLSTAEYPLNPNHMGASVIVAGYDQNLSRYTDSPESRDLSIGIPQIYAAENVLPTKEGIASVVYQQVRADSGAQTYGRHPASVYMADGTALPVVLQALPVTGGALPRLTTLRTDGVISVITVGTVPKQAATILASQLTTAYVQGVSYLYLPESCGAYRPGLHIFNGDATHILYEPAVLEGIDQSEVLGIMGVNGYLIVYTDKAIAWSSTLQLVPDRAMRDTSYAVGELVRNPNTATTHGLRYRCTVAGTTAAIAPAYPDAVGNSVVDGTATFVAEALTVDFVPSLETGAGGGLLEDARGSIITMLPGPSGFMVYTSQNIVAATYTNNSEYPYQFRSLPNSAGIQHASCVTSSAELGWHYALTTSGLMQVASTGCKLVFPAVTHWLNSKEQVRFATPADGAILAVHSGLSYYRIGFVQNRYLCISKGPSEASMGVCLVYDTALDRWGQLYKLHAYVIDRTTPSLPGDVRQDLPIIVEPNGTTHTWRAFSGTLEGVPAQPGSSWVLLGRYRHSRSQNICVQEVTISSCYGPGATPQVRPYVTPDGGSAPHALGPYLYRDVRGIRPTGVHKYLSRTEGLDVSLLVEGPFELSSIELTLTTGGRR